MTHLPTEEATRRLKDWRAREEGFLCIMSVVVGITIGEGVDAAPRWMFIVGIVEVLLWLISLGNRMRAERRLELSVEERDTYREQRWQELHQEELLELHDTISQLRRELADTTPNVH